MCECAPSPWPTTDYCDKSVRSKRSGTRRGGDNSLAQEETTVALSDTIATAETRDVTPGDEIRLAGRAVATIGDVAAYTA